MRFAASADYDTRRYLINASLIVCGIFTLIKSYGIKHPKLPFQLGAGVCSVMGVSFTSLPSACLFARVPVHRS